MRALWSISDDDDVPNTEGQIGYMQVITTTYVSLSRSVCLSVCLLAPNPAIDGSLNGANDDEGRSNQNLREEEEGEEEEGVDEESDPQKPFNNQHNNRL